MEALIFDHVRTPRGKGKPDGALHEVTPVWLAAQPLVALRDRNQLDTSVVDDVVMGCVVPVGEQGGNVGRMAVLQADYAQSVAGVQLNRYCGSGLEAVSFAAAKVMAGQADMTIGAGVEMMSRVPMGSDGGAWAQDPQLANKTYFVMQGISADLLASLRGHSRRDLDAYSAESHQRAAKAWAEGRFDKSVVPVKDFLGMTLLEKDETIRPETTADSLAVLKPAFTEMGQKYGYDSVPLQIYYHQGSHGGEPRVAVRARPGPRTPNSVLRPCCTRSGWSSSRARVPRRSGRTGGEWRRTRPSRWPGSSGHSCRRSRRPPRRVVGCRERPTP